MATGAPSNHSNSKLKKKTKDEQQQKQKMYEFHITYRNKNSVQQGLPGKSIMIFTVGCKSVTAVGRQH